MKKTCAIFYFSLLVFNANAQNPPRAVAKIFNPTVPFTCIAVDSNNAIWAGTNGQGIYKIKNEISEPIIIATNNFNKVNIKQIAAEKDKGIWVAHEGYSGTSYGGIEFLDANVPSIRQHYGAISLISTGIKGFPSRRVQGIAIDKNNKVWSAHSYHDLTVIGGNPYYLVNPGGMGFKTPAMTVFDTIPAGLEPYPAYTRNTPITQSAGTRVCPSVGIDTVHNEVWLGGASYNALPVFQGSRISRFSLSGAFLGTIDDSNSPLPLGNNGNARTIAIHFDKKGNGWVGFNAGRGLGVKNDLLGWTYIGLPSLVPAGTNINQHAIASNAKGEVFIGTNAGLLKYIGGPFTAANSYVLYTAALNHLPSNNITGVTIDKSGVVWIATDAGIASLVEANFTAFNIRQPVIDKQELMAVKFPVCLANDQLKQLNDSLITINVAADSSNSTLIVYTGTGPKTKVLKMANLAVPNANYTGEYGYFQELVRNDDSLVYLYRHPSYVFNGNDEKFVSYQFVVKDTVNLALPHSIEGTIRVYHPPVLMVHGVWSYKGSLKKLADSLYQSKLYDPYQVNIIHYDRPDHPEAINSQVAYNYWVPDGIDALLSKCAQNYLSAGKVDLVGHSRGGIFARLYIQSTVGKQYRNDVNKLITLNTPHFGAQSANLVLDKRNILPTVLGSPKSLELGKIFERFTLEGNDYYDSITQKIKPYNDDLNGAAELKVNWPAIDDVLNGPTRLNETVPKHAIMSRHKFAGTRANYLLPFLVNGVQGLSGYFLPVAGGALLAIRVYVLSMGSRCLEGPLDECFKEMFNGQESDLVVPIISGLGGLKGNAVSDFSQLYPNLNIAHSKKKLSPFAPDALSVTEKTEVMARVLSLLRDNPSKAVTDPATSRFTKDHYDNTKLQYTFLPNLPGVPRPANTLSIDSVQFANGFKNSHHLPGDSVWFSVKGNNLTHIIVSYQSASLNDTWTDIRDSTNGTFIFPVPREATGKITAVAMGFNGAGLVALDTAFIYIDLPSGIVLDSIRIADRNNLFTVAKYDSIVVAVNGYYSDHIVRDITTNAGLVYTSEEANAVGAVSGIKGARVGYDRFFVAYQGKKDTGYARVTDIALTGPLPVTLTYFGGRFENNSVLLNWVTQQEANSAYFEIEASKDGKFFAPVGRINAKGNSSNITRYNYTDYTHFSNGNNYYRLKQVDLDGQYTYSLVVLIKLSGDKKPVIIIYPNPFVTSVNINLSQKLQTDWQINLYSVSGQLMVHRELSHLQNQHILNIANIPAGIYQLMVTEKNGAMIYTGKIIKQ